MARKLTPKQKKFAEEYVKSGNGTRAAIAANYKSKSAHSIATENLQKPAVKNYIKELMDKAASDRIMDATEAIELLTRIARGEETETKVVATQFNVSEIEVPADLKTKIAAVKEILKRYPDSDDFVKAQLHKLNADIRQSTANARIAEHKADELEGVGRTNPLLVALTGQAKNLLPKDGDVDADTTE